MLFVNFFQNILVNIYKRHYYVNGNKLSKIDFMLLYLCSINENSVIVTEDKKLLKASKDILGNNKSINLKEFLISLN